MDVWEVILYGFGTFLALRVLIALMQQHRRNTLRQLAAEHQRKQFEEALRTKSPQREKSNNKAA